MFFPMYVVEIGGIVQNFEHFLWHILLVMDDFLNHLYGLKMTVLAALTQLLYKLLVL